jgi:hypothetical protein
LPTHDIGQSRHKLVSDLLVTLNIGMPVTTKIDSTLIKIVFYGDVVYQFIFVKEPLLSRRRTNRNKHAQDR